MSQNTQVLELLKSGPLTALEALHQIGCFRLASRINDLRQQGHDIETETITLANGKHIAQYKLKERQHGRETH